MTKSTKMQRLEDKFGMAKTLVEDLSEAIDDLGTSTNLPDVTGTPTTDVVVVPPEESILSMDTLKSDFMMVRNNIMALVTSGQQILSQASVLDVADLKPSHLEALANLQRTLGDNLQLMINIYKDLAAIEKSRIKPVSKVEAPSQVNTGTINNTNVLFTGSSAELMELINSKGTANDFIEIKNNN